MLHSNSHTEKHIRSAENRQTTRFEMHSAKGMEAGRIRKNGQIRRFKLQISKAQKELYAIAALELLMAEKSESRIRKEADAGLEVLHGKPKKRDRNAQSAKKRKKRRFEMDQAEQTD